MQPFGTQKFPKNPNLSHNKNPGDRHRSPWSCFTLSLQWSTNPLQAQIYLVQVPLGQDIKVQQNVWQKKLGHLIFFLRKLVWQKNTTCNDFDGKNQKLQQQQFGQQQFCNFFFIFF